MNLVVGMLSLQEQPSHCELVQSTRIAHSVGACVRVQSDSGSFSFKLYVLIEPESVG